ncbi:MAG: shikimate kinase AroK [Gammaproteobacteria bacterium]|nr:shikimate kinase AroK [Gammaproteobacteria bacterium]
MVDTQNIILIGAMGVGKSTVGKRLAKKLAIDFYDSDQEIVKKTGVDIATIFEYEGEEGFRNREEKILKDLCKLEPIVLATGGGAILSKKTRELLTMSGTVFYLKASIETILNRAKNENSRPLLNTSDKRETISYLLKQRTPLYESVAHHTINTNRHTVNWSADQILKILKN